MQLLMRKCGQEKAHCSCANISVFSLFLPALFSCSLCLSHGQESGGHPEMGAQVSAVGRAGGSGVPRPHFCSCMRRGEALGWAPPTSCKTPHFQLAVTFATSSITLLFHRRGWDFAASNRAVSKPREAVISLSWVIWLLGRFSRVSCAGQGCVLLSEKPKAPAGCCGRRNLIPAQQIAPGASNHERRNAELGARLGKAPGCPSQEDETPGTSVRPSRARAQECLVTSSQKHSKISGLKAFRAKSTSSTRAVLRVGHISCCRNGISFPSPSFK